MKEIIFATTNQNKVREVGMMCNNPDLKLLTLKDIGLDGCKTMMPLPYARKHAAWRR